MTNSGRDDRQLCESSESPDPSNIAARKRRSKGGILQGYFWIGLMMAVVGFLSAVISGQAYELWYSNSQDIVSHLLTLICTVGVAACCGGFIAMFVFGTAWALRSIVMSFRSTDY